MVTESPARKYYISEAVDSFGVTGYTWRIFFLLGAAMAFVGYDYMIVSYTMAQIQAEWSLSAVQTGSLSSWSLAGLVLGSVVSGILSDRVGRRKALTAATALYSLLTVPIYFVHSFEAFAFFRICAGLGLGASIPVVTTYLSESVPTRHRGLFVTLGMAWMVLGWVLAPLAAILVVPGRGWRPCYLIGGLPFLYSILLYYRMPESLHWLAGKGRYREAAEGLARMRPTGAAGDWSADGILVPPRRKVSGFRALFSPQYRTATAGIWITYFCGNYIVYGINAWLPSLMMEKGFRLASAYGLAMANSAAAILANALSGFAAEALGRRKNLVLGFSAAALGIVALAFAGDRFQALLLSNILMGFTMNYAICSVQPVMTESYPTEFRNTGVAWCQAFGRLGAVLAPILGGAVLELRIGYSRSFLFYLIPAAAGALGAFLLIRNETRGRSLDQLAAG